MINASPYRRKESQLNLKGKGYLGISLHSQSHTGESLEAIVRWINTQTDFSSFMIGLSDTLNRFNDPLFPKDKSQAWKRCISDGNQWIKQNKETLDKLNIPYRISRWDHWRSNYNPQIKQYISFYNALFDSDELLRHALLSDINRYCERKHEKSINDLPIHHVINCKNYLIEELAVYSILYKKYGPCVSIYPAKQLECMRVIRDGLVQGIPDTIDSSEFVRLSLHMTPSFPDKIAA